MKPNIKINDEIVARVVDYEERKKVEARILRDIESWEAEIIWRLLMQQMWAKIGDTASAGQRTDDNGRLFMWIIIREKVEDKKPKKKRAK